MLQELIDPRIKTVAVIREPLERLYSSIRWELNKQGSANKVRKIINETNYFNNVIHNYINSSEDLGIKTKKVCETRKKEMDTAMKEIIYLDITDKETANIIKSAYLTSNQMPNIIQPIRINENRYSSKEAKLEREVTNLVKLCESKGFLIEDNKIDYKNQFEASRKRVWEELEIDNSQEIFRIHPLIFDYRKKKFILTEDKFKS